MDIRSFDDPTAETVGAAIDPSTNPLEINLQAEKEAIKIGQYNQLAQLEAAQKFEKFYQPIAKANKLPANPMDPANNYDFAKYHQAVESGVVAPPQYDLQSKKYKLPPSFAKPGHPDFYQNMDPSAWTLDQAKDYIKKNPPADPNQEAQYNSFLDQKKQQIDNIQAHLDAYSAYTFNQHQKDLNANIVYPHQDLLSDPKKMSAFDSFAIQYSKGIAGFFTRPFGHEPFSNIPQQDIQLSLKDHPIASGLGKAFGDNAASALAIAAAPESLLAQLFAFGSQGAILEKGKQATTGSLMDTPEAKNAALVKATVRSAAYAPLWVYTKGITLGGPILSIAARAGARGVGSAGIETAAGATPQEAAMSGIMTAGLSGIMDLTPIAIENVNKAVRDKSIDDMANTLMRNDNELKSAAATTFQQKFGQAPNEQDLLDRIKAGLKIDAVKNNISTSQLAQAAIQLRKRFTPINPEVLADIPGRRGQAGSVPNIAPEPGDIVRASIEGANIVGKISKIVGDNALLVSSIGKELSVPLTQVQKTGLLPQEVPKAQMKKVPAEKQQFVQELFKAENPDVVDSMIHSDPYYQADLALNKELGNKAFVKSSDPKLWPDYYHSYLKDFDRAEVTPPTGQPEAIIFVGFPASGKSQLIKALGKRDTHIQIDPDDPKISHIPETSSNPALAPHVQDESAYMAETLLRDRVLDQKKNIVWPKDGKNPKTLVEIAARLKKEGYKTVLYFNDLSSVESKKRAYKRYLEEKRLIPVDYIDGIGDLTIQEVYDTVKASFDEYASWDVNKKFGEAPTPIEKGTGNVQHANKAEISQADALPGSGSSTKLQGSGGQGGRDDTGKPPRQSGQETSLPKLDPTDPANPAEDSWPEDFQKTVEQEASQLSPEDQAKFDLQMDDFRKTPEGNLFVAIKSLGGIAPHKRVAAAGGLFSSGELAQEYKDIPFYLKNKKGRPLDELVSELSTYGWIFDNENDLKQEIVRQSIDRPEKVDRASLQKIIREAKKNQRYQEEILNALSGKRRKFINTVKRSPRTAPEVAKNIESRYDPITNAETLKQAQEFVDSDYNQAVQMVEGNMRASTFSNAVAIVLIRKAQDEGRMADAIRLVERTAEKNTEVGRTIQALSMYNRLSPEGILMLAQRTVKAARENVKQKSRLTNFDKASKGLDDKGKARLARKMGVPYLAEDVAKDILERARKLGGAPQWEMPSTPEAKNAIQHLIDEFYSLGVEGQNVLPAEVRNAMQRTIEEFQKLGVAGENTPEAKNAIQQIFDEFQKLGVAGENTPMGPGIQQLLNIGPIKVSRDRLIETALMIKQITDLVPRSLGEKISMIQTMAQLLNPKTFVRNILGNIVFQTTENIADVFGAALDIAVSLRTGKRSVYLPNLMVQGKGMAQGLQEGTQEAILGINLKESQSKFTLPKNGVFDKGVMGALEKLLRIFLGATDRAFYQGAFNQSLREQTLAAGVEEPTEAMIEKAHLIGLYRTFQDDNILSDQFVKLKKWLNNWTANVPGMEGKFGLGDLVIKYPKTPASIMARGIEYSPFGFMKTVFKLAQPLTGEEFDQEGFVRSTARAFTGTSLLVGTGAILGALGIISGKRAKDKDVAATREGVGIREYQINVSALKRFASSGLDPDMAKLREDDVLVTYDWMQPASIGLALGANMVLDPKTSLVDKALNIGDATLQASNTLQEQPLMQGLKILTSKQDLSTGISDIIQSLPASFVPTFFNQVRQLTDNISRNTKDPNYFKEAYNKAVNRVPAAAGSLPPRITPLGNEKEMYQLGSNNPFNVFLNPAFVSKYKPDPVSRMVLDIWENSGQTIQFPRVASAKIKFGKQEGSGATPEPIELNPSQYLEFQKYIGNKTSVLFTMLADRPGFMALPDEKKAKMLQDFLTDINNAAKIEVLGSRPSTVSKDTMAIIKAIGKDHQAIKENMIRSADDPTQDSGIRAVDEVAP